MRKHLFFALFLFFFTSYAQAQITSQKKNSRGYLRFGFSSFGQELKDDLSNFSVNNGGNVDAEASMLANMLEGRYGAKRGYVLEFGRNYYFNNKSLIPLMSAKLGLDWTQLSITYNDLDFKSWSDRDFQTGYVASQDGASALSISSMIGPVFSIQPIGKLVIDARVQLAATYFANLTNYYAENESTGDERYFSFFPSFEDEDEGLGAITKVGSFGLKPNFGATVRYGVIGLALDYAPGSIKSEYQSHEGDGEAKFKNNVFQIKASLTL